MDLGKELESSEVRLWRALNAKLGAQTLFYLRNEESLKAFKNTQMSNQLVTSNICFALVHFLSYKLKLCKDSTGRTGHLNRY